jgi:osmotically-inducible protein OsmY
MKLAIGPHTDVQLKDEILQELKWEPSVNEAQIGVIVDDGVVTLSGAVTHWPERDAAERAVRRVFGVKAIANELEVKLPVGAERTDADIAREAANALNWNTYVPRDRIQVSVHRGWITLTGEVEWQYQRTSAEDAVRHLLGVKGTVNQITLKPRLAPAEVKGKIIAALERSALVEAKAIAVETRDRKVILRGKVRSWVERDAVEQAAWAAPGVSFVENDLRVEYA